MDGALDRACGELNKRSIDICVSGSGALAFSMSGLRHARPENAQGTSDAQGVSSAVG
jgi:hypothetical protein